MRNKHQSLLTEQNVADFKMLHEQLESFYKEMKEFSKKKPDDALNKLKIKMANRLLSKIRQLLKSEPTIDFLDILDEDTLPSNSDVVLILGQYVSAMFQFRIKYQSLPVWRKEY